MEKENVLQRKGRSRIRKRRQRYTIIFAGTAWLALMLVLAYVMGLIGPGDEDIVATDRGRADSNALTPLDIDYTHPVGLVIEITNLENSPLSPFEYIYLGQRIPLAMDASVSLAYFEACREEIIRGADLVVGRGGSEVGTHGSKRGRAVTCRPVRMMMPAHLVQPGKEAYVSPFDTRSWNEVTVKSTRPVFILPEKVADAKISIEISDEDTAEDGSVWTGEMTSHFLAYPADAPRLVFGRPYSVRALSESGETYTAIFSIEPNSGTSLSVLNDFVVMNVAQGEQP